MNSELVTRLDVKLVCFTAHGCGPAPESHRLPQRAAVCTQRCSYHIAQSTRGRLRIHRRTRMLRALAQLFKMPPMMEPAVDVVELSDWVGR